jgi:hypothetical protein
MWKREPEQICIWNYLMDESMEDESEGRRTWQEDLLEGYCNNPDQKPGVVVHACNPGTQETEARGLCIRDPFGLHSDLEAS